MKATHTLFKKTQDPENHETLERLRRWPALRAKWAGSKVRIWSREHRCFWRPNSKGYTPTEEGAGIYSFEEAFATTCHCSPEKGIEFKRVDEHAKLFFSYDPENGIQFFYTSEQAKVSADSILDSFRDWAVDSGWPENPTDICWGEVRESVVEISREKKPENPTQAEIDQFGEFDELIEYALHP